MTKVIVKPPIPPAPIKPKDKVDNKIKETQQKVAGKTAKVTPKTAVKK